VRKSDLQGHFMTTPQKPERLAQAIQKESKKFEELYLWIEKHMPPSFFEEIDEETLPLIVHALMAFDLQHYFSHIDLKHSAIVLCPNGPDADLRILKHYRMHGIKKYRAFVSDAPAPFSGVKKPLRLAVIRLTQYQEKTPSANGGLPEEQTGELFKLVKSRHPDLTVQAFEHALSEISPRFLRSLTKERLVIVLDLFLRATSRDECQYEVVRNEDWSESKDFPSMRVILAWKNVPKHNFLYRLAQTVHRHKLAIKRMNATYVHPYSNDSVFIMSLGLDGMGGKAAWEEANLEDFLQELATVKYFEGMDTIELVFVDSGLVSGNVGNLIKSMTTFVHQALVHADLNIYSFSHVEEALCRHPELTVQICQAFEAKFHPTKHDINLFQKIKDEVLKLVSELDTGHQINDIRRKNILKQAINFVDFTLKTNFYKTNKTAFSFRLNPAYLNELPFDRKEKFPELPYAVFFMKGMHFFGFHIRFKDLSRGGLRTVFPEKTEPFLVERNNIFAECYALAYTQQKKNKDIPEGGAKGVILLDPYERALVEEEITKKELEDAGIPEKQREEKLKVFRKEHRSEYLYQAQRAYIESFMSLINCSDEGVLKAKNVVDYYKKPEYIYLGPDENMHDNMIIWISNYSVKCGYKPGNTFMSSKPGAGINHKEFGVTSLGVNVYMEEVLKYLGINPQQTPFKVKMSGGPDGDVAGNQMLNLHRFCPKTAKLLTTIDVSGTIYDPEGLDLDVMAKLFHDVKPIRFYPPEKLSEGGYLLDTMTKKEQSTYAQKTLCWRKKEGKLVEDWVSGNEMNHLLRHTVHQTKADVFIPGGGRPRTLNEHNYQDYLDEAGLPSSKAIVEGANLYLTQQARRELERLGVLVIKDSSANKGGVICSSFEVLTGLVLSESEFIANKPTLMQEILEIIKMRALDEATLMLKVHRETNAYLTDISEWISEKINLFMYELLDYLQTQTLPSNPSDPLIQCLLNYCPPLIRTNYQERVLKSIPDLHKKAIISVYIAQKLVYKKGLDWSPRIVDVLPLILKDPQLMQP
jgi:glutamate dehydrogenase